MVRSYKQLVRLVAFVEDLYRWKFFPFSYYGDLIKLSKGFFYTKVLSYFDILIMLFQLLCKLSALISGTFLCLFKWFLRAVKSCFWIWMDHLFIIQKKTNVLWNISGFMAPLLSYHNNCAQSLPWFLRQFFVYSDYFLRVVESFSETGWIIFYDSKNAYFGTFQVL